MELKKAIAKITGVLAIVCASTSANAALMGVSTIEISNAINEWLQVAEFEAYDLSNVNVALAGSASAPDSWNATSTPDKAIDGNTDGNFNNGSVFHEGNPRTGDTLTITLAAPTDLASIAIFGRTNCCSSRDVYNIVFKDIQGGEIRTLRSVDATGRSGNSAEVRFVPAPAPLALMGFGLIALSLRNRGKDA